MIFVGDTALPFKNAIKLELPEKLSSQNWLINLEGALVTDPLNYFKDNLVVNSVDAIADLSKRIKCYVALNNNHIFDNNNFNDTKKNLKELGLKSFGAGNNIEEASKPLIIESEKLVILSFGWSVIGCKYAGINSEGVNPLINNYVIEELVKYRKLYKNYSIVCLFHWNYELEQYPMPSQRYLAHKLIDLGCDGIIGLHPHRVQGYEVYNNKPIIYSLGNWLFRQSIYRNGKLNFPEFCNLQLAFEFSKNNKHKCHFFYYNSSENQVSFLRSEHLPSQTLLKESIFTGMKNSEYEKWFAKNRYHKKLLPIYKKSDSKRMELFKNNFNFFRTSFIDFLVKYNLK